MSRSLLFGCAVLTAVFLGVVASASNEQAADAKAVADAPPKDEVVCRRERPVGSHVPVWVCRDAGDADLEREDAQRALGPLRTMSGTVERRPGDDPRR